MNHIEVRRRSLQANRLTLLYTIVALLALVGLVDALYLTVQHLKGRSARCTVATGCSEVLGSAYASFSGMPIAAFGALAYFTVFSLATLLVFGYSGVRIALMFVVAAMFATTLWLLYVQAFVLRAFCDYCLLSAAFTLTLATLIVVERFESRSRKQ